MQGSNIKLNFPRVIFNARVLVLPPTKRILDSYVKHYASTQRAKPKTANLQYCIGVMMMQKLQRRITEATTSPKNQTLTSRLLDLTKTPSLTTSSIRESMQ
jgi:hypothetical protein